MRKELEIDMSKSPYLLNGVLIAQDSLVGNVFWEYTVIGVNPDRRGKRWECKCSCGKIQFVDGYMLRDGSRKSCGCKSLKNFSPAEKFWAKVAKAGVDDCWNWVGTKTWRGYGGFSRDRKTIQAHRFSYSLHYGEVPKGFEVMHSCDNPSCVNPKHLSVGTPMDNTKDKVAKKRHAHGETSGVAKLTEKEVLEIRAMRSEGITLAKISKQFGIGTAQVWNIYARKSWKHI